MKTPPAVIHCPLFSAAPARSQILAAILLLAAAMILAVSDAALAQQVLPQADPADFGLEVPQAPPKSGDGRVVQVRGPNDGPVVGRILVEVGDRLVVMLPNGRVASVSREEAAETDRPFVPATQDEMIAELTAGTFKDFQTRKTRRYVYVYNSSDAFYRATSRLLETMYPSLLAYCKRQKLDVHDPEVPLVVVMFRTEEEFDAYHEMGEGVVAYYNAVNNYIVMYEQSKMAEVAPELAVKQSISTIAHEGVHQILHNIGVQQRLSEWPMWISEGLAEYMAPTSTGDRARWKGVGLVNDLRMHSLVESLKQRPLGQSGGGLVRQTVESDQLDSTGYAAAWALTHYLTKRRPEQFFDYLREVSRIGPLEGDEIDGAGLFAKHFGPDFGAIENALTDYLKTLPYVDPIANQTHYVGVIETQLRRSWIVALSPASIRQWQQETVVQLTPQERATARFSIRAFANRALAERAARALHQ